jgi:mono/diheme cytochrome c family protein
MTLITDKATIGLAVVGILALLASGGAIFIGSGAYNIGADDHHTKVVLAIIEMSAMPAWGKTLDDAAIWDVVSFVRKMPVMTSATYQQLSQGH